MLGCLKTGQHRFLPHPVLFIISLVDEGSQITEESIKRDQRETVKLVMTVDLETARATRRLSCYISLQTNINRTKGVQAP